MTEGSRANGDRRWESPYFEGRGNRYADGAPVHDRSTSLCVGDEPPSSPADAFRVSKRPAPSAPGLLAAPHPSWPFGSGREARGEQQRPSPFIPLPRCSSEGALGEEQDL